MLFLGIRRLHRLVFGKAPQSGLAAVDAPLASQIVSPFSSTFGPSRLATPRRYSASADSCRVRSVVSFAPVELA